jgi:hypothetical protein
LGVPNPAPPKFEVDGCPKVVTLPKETRLFSFGDGFGSRITDSLASGDDLSGEYDYRKPGLLIKTYSKMATQDSSLTKWISHRLRHELLGMRPSQTMAS